MTKILARRASRSRRDIRIALEEFSDYVRTHAPLAEVSVGEDTFIVTGGPNPHLPAIYEGYPVIYKP